ncbi:hypothetical protein ES703_01484 [subsurface metagenome]
MIGYREEGALPGLFFHRNAAEMLLNQPLNPVLIEITHGYYGHEVRSVPVGVEAPDGVIVKSVQDRLLTDRQAHRVPGILEQDRELLIAHPGFSPPALPPLLNDHAALLLDFLVLVTHTTGPVLQDLETLFNNFNAVRGQCQHIHGLVETGIGVYLRPEAHTDGLQVVHQLLFGEVFGAVEGHVFGQMGQPLLVIVLQHRTDVHCQPQLGPLLRLMVYANYVFQPILQGANRHLRVNGQGLARPGGLLQNRTGHQAKREQSNCGYVESLHKESPLPFTSF